MEQRSVWINRATNQTIKKINISHIVILFSLSAAKTDWRSIGVYDKGTWIEKIFSEIIFEHVRFESLSHVVLGDIPHNHITIGTIISSD